MMIVLKMEIAWKTSININSCLNLYFYILTYKFSI